MQNDPLLAPHIQTIDHFFCTDLWNFLAEAGTPLSTVEIAEENNP